MALLGEGRRLRVLGVPVDPLDMRGTLAWIERRIDTREAGTHLCVNAANVVRAHDDPEYLALLERSDVVGSDGQPFVWAARLLGQRLPERVAGIDLMEQVLARSRDVGWAVYLLGGQDHVVTRLADRLSAEGVKVVGFRHGYLGPGDEAEVVAEIRSSGADVLFVGMPTPTKERFVVDELAPTGVPVRIGVGGSFDVLAGELRRAPRLLQRLGLEWLFRLAQEPRRLFARYAVTNARFLGLLGVAMVRGAWGRSAGASATSSSATSSSATSSSATSSSATSSSGSSRGSSTGSSGSSAGTTAGSERAGRSPGRSSNPSSEA